METKKTMSLLSYGAVGALVAILSTYYFIYNPEVYDNSRFIESFKQPLAAAKREPKKLKALQSLQSKGYEWAHYQLVDAIQRQNMDVVDLYLEAGMPLRDKGVIIDQMLENPSQWIALVKRLGWDSQEKLSGLFEVPRHLDGLDPYFKKVEVRYAISHDIAFKNHYLKFQVINNAWVAEKSGEIANVNAMCDGDTRCITVNVLAIETEYQKKRPVAPEKDLILWQDPELTLMSAAILLGNQDFITFLEGKGVTERVNNMVMSDRMVVVFEVADDKTISYPEGIQVKALTQVEIPVEPQTE